MADIWWFEKRRRISSCLYNQNVVQQCEDNTNIVLTMLFWGVSEKHGISVSVNDFVIRAAALALKEVPEANGNALNSGLCF